MFPPTAGGAAFLGRTGKAADQSEAFHQGRRADAVLLQQFDASLDHLGLAEAKGLAQAVEPGRGFRRVSGDAGMSLHRC